MLNAVKLIVANLLRIATPGYARTYAHGTPDEVAAKWLRGVQNAQQDMEAGVMRVNVSPGQSAANKKNKWIAALQDPATQDKWERGVRSVSLGQWQQAMKDYGVQRAAQGAQAKIGKFTAIMGPLLQHIDATAAAVRAMPDNTYAEREQRMIAMARGMRNFKRPAGA